MAAALGPRAARACEVCYGRSDSPWIDAGQAAVWLLLGVTVLVQGAFVIFFVRLRSRTRAQDLQRDEIKLVEGKGAA